MKTLRIISFAVSITIANPLLRAGTDPQNVSSRGEASLQISKDLITDFRSVLIDHGNSADIFSTPQSEAGIYLRDKGEQYEAVKLSVKAPATISQWKPYLQTPTANSIIVSWRADGYQPEVKIGTSPTELTRSVEGYTQTLTDESANFKYHKVLIENLTPDTKYYYRITGDTEIFSFRTQPETGSNRNYRVLILGDHQKLDRSGYEWLINAAKETLDKKYGNWKDAVDLVLNPGDQVNEGIYSLYEKCHFFKSYGISPYLPIMTTLGNHEMKQDPNLDKYSTIFEYEKLSYQGISSGNDLYYAIQEGRTLFVFLCTEAPYTGDEQINWLQQVLDKADKDNSVDFVMSMCHRPMCSETYTNDYSPWLQQVAVPVLGTCKKHVLNIAAHHHYYQRGHVTDYPFFHIISGGASWDQTWDLAPSKEDMNEVQKTLDYWTYQIIDFNPNDKTMQVECYSIGNKNIVHNNILIDSFTRNLADCSKPERPEIIGLSEKIELPGMIQSSSYKSEDPTDFNSCQYQISASAEFKKCVIDKIQHHENLFEDEGAPYYLPIDTQKEKSAFNLELSDNDLTSGVYYIRIRHRNKNGYWSDWSDKKSFMAVAEKKATPEIIADQKIYKTTTPVNISFNNAPVGTKAWIGIYKHGTPTDGSVKSLKWAYTQDKNGSVQFSGLTPGAYFAILFADAGYIPISEKQIFLITTEDIGALSIDKSIYSPGEEIRVNFQNMPGNANDWIGIYRLNEDYKPGDKVYKSSCYVYNTTEAKSGDVGLKSESKLPAGDYFVGYFLKGGYEEIAERSYFRIGDPVKLSMSGSVFPEQEYIAFMLSDKPLSPDVYLVIRNADTQTETERIRLNSNLSELGILRKFDKG
ncbi:MAG: purple acid phosphatase family protein, partial [Bacteroidales bacterium]